MTFEFRLKSHCFNRVDSILSVGAGFKRSKTIKITFDNKTPVKNIPQNDVFAKIKKNN